MRGVGSPKVHDHDEAVFFMAAWQSARKSGKPRQACRRAGLMALAKLRYRRGTQ